MITRKNRTIALMAAALALLVGLSIWLVFRSPAVGVPNPAPAAANEVATQMAVTSSQQQSQQALPTQQPQQLDVAPVAPVESAVEQGLEIQPEPAIAGTYTVKTGDVASAIALAHDVTLEALGEANPQIQDLEMIYVGQVVNLPVAPQDLIDLAEIEGDKVRVQYGDGYVWEFTGYRSSSLEADIFTVDEAKALPLGSGEGSSQCEYDAFEPVRLFSDTTAAHVTVEDSGVFTWSTQAIRDGITTAGDDPAKYYLVGDASHYIFVRSDGSAINSSAAGNTFALKLSDFKEVTLTKGAWYAVREEQLDGFMAIRWRHLDCRGKARLPQFFPSVPSGSAWTGVADINQAIAWLRTP